MNIAGSGGRDQPHERRSQNVRPGMRTPFIGNDFQVRPTITEKTFIVRKGGIGNTGSALKDLAGALKGFGSALDGALGGGGKGGSCRGRSGYPKTPKINLPAIQKAAARDAETFAFMNDDFMAELQSDQDLIMNLSEIPDQYREMAVDSIMSPLMPEGKQGGAIKAYIDTAGEDVEEIKDPSTLGPNTTVIDMDRTEPDAAYGGYGYDMIQATRNLEQLGAIVPVYSDKGEIEGKDVNPDVFENAPLYASLMDGKEGQKFPVLTFSLFNGMSEQEKQRTLDNYKKFTESKKAVENTQALNQETLTSSLYAQYAAVNREIITDAQKLHQRMEDMMFDKPVSSTDTATTILERFRNEFDPTFRKYIDTEEKRRAFGATVAKHGMKLVTKYFNTALKERTKARAADLERNLAMATGNVLKDAIDNGLSQERDLRVFRDIQQTQLTEYYKHYRGDGLEKYIKDAVKPTIETAKPEDLENAISMIQEIKQLQTSPGSYYGNIPKVAKALQDLEDSVNKRIEERDAYVPFINENQKKMVADLKLQYSYKVSNALTDSPDMNSQDLADRLVQEIDQSYGDSLFRGELKEHVLDEITNINARRSVQEDPVQIENLNEIAMTDTDPTEARSDVMNAWKAGTISVVTRNKLIDQVNKRDLSYRLSEGGYVRFIKESRDDLISSIKTNYSDLPTDLNVQVSQVTTKFFDQYEKGLRKFIEQKFKTSKSPVKEFIEFNSFEALREEYEQQPGVQERKSNFLAGMKDYLVKNSPAAMEREKERKRQEEEEIAQLQVQEEQRRREQARLDAQNAEIARQKKEEGLIPYTIKKIWSSIF